MNKHGVSRRWFTETYVKLFEDDALRTITNITEKEYAFYGKLKKIISSQVYLSIDTEQHILKCEFLYWGFSKIDFLDRFGITYLKNGFL